MFCAVFILLFLVYAYAKLSSGICKTHTCLVGKTALVTGGNRGIGYETCLNLAARGCRVIIADKCDAEQSRIAIVKATHNQDIHAMSLALSSFKSVRHFAVEFTRHFDRLDILIQNAGVYNQPEPKLTEDGLNYTWQVNYFGAFLLTHLLVDLLKKSAPSRLIFTSSLACFKCRSWDPTEIGLGLREIRANETLSVYARTKMAQVLCSRVFAEKLKQFGVTSNAVHPGYVGTKIMKEAPLNMRVFTFLCHFFIKDPWQGAQTATHVATSLDLTNVTGQFFQDCQPFSMFLPEYGQKTIDAMWELSEKICKLTEDERL